MKEKNKTTYQPRGCRITTGEELPKDDVNPVGYSPEKPPNKKNSMGEKIKNILHIILTLYGISVLLFATYFEYLYAREHGFINWLLLGWVIPFLKALIWPITLF